MDDSEDNDGISAAAFDYTISNFVDNLYGYPEGERCQRSDPSLPASTSSLTEEASTNLGAMESNRVKSKRSNREVSTPIRGPSLFKSLPKDEKREWQPQKTVVNRYWHDKEIAYQGDYLSPRWGCGLARETRWALTPSLIVPQAVGSQSQSCYFSRLSLQTRRGRMQFQ